MKLRWAALVVPLFGACEDLGSASHQDLGSTTHPAAQDLGSTSHPTAPPATGATAATACEQAITEVVAKARASLVVIHVGDREGIERPLGAGFIVSKGGLVVTNLHVIGEGRPITVELESKERRPVEMIYAHDRSLDLAVLRIPQGGLRPLPLGDSKTLQQGQPVVALGNPRGLERSVASGVVSALRKIRGIPMIQIALPIEPGNSGGPLIDLSGRAMGVVSMKSTLTENLGFAAQINVLKPMLERPNPVPLERWMTISALDRSTWTPRMGARWRQRAGKVIVDRPGQSFGGRALCLWNEPAPKPPYEVGVEVRLSQPDGAAGIAIAADGQHQHYGFYPSRGRMRLTRFGGPSVRDWEVLYDQPSEHLRPDSWNTLKLRREKSQLVGFLNGHQLFSIRDNKLSHPRVGLVKFRDTQAEFKRFSMGRALAEHTISKRRLQRVDRVLGSRAEPSQRLKALLQDPEALFAKTEALRQQLRSMERISKQVAERATTDALAQALRAPEPKIDLFSVAMLIAKLDNPQLNIPAYRAELDRLVQRADAQMPKGASDSVRLRALTRFFIERGFRGSYDEYYHRSNSYLNEVIDDREGLPISLSVLFICLAERLGLNVVGVGLPGHFVARFIPTRGSNDVLLLDVFNGVKSISFEEARQTAHRLTGARISRADLKPSSKRDIALRMLRNLQGAAEREGDLTAQLRYLSATLAIDPGAGQARLHRARLLLSSAPRALAEPDIQYLLEHPESIDPAALASLKRMLR